MLTCSEIKEDFDGDPTKSLNVLTNRLSDIAHRYTTLGLQLDIGNGTIKKIEKRVVDVRVCLETMLNEWNVNEIPYRDILVAIKSPTIRNMRLAKELEKKWMEEGKCESLFIVAIIWQHVFPP